MAKFLVTGGAGFIGSNIVHKLVEMGEKVTVVDNLITGNFSNLEDLENKIKFVKGDIRNLSLLKEIFEGIDYILHQAALPSVLRSIENPILTNEININGTLNVLIAAKERKIKKVIFASSSSIYGDSLDLPKKEEMGINPLSPYALTKYTSEKYCQIFNNLYGLLVISLRYFNVFGPRQNPKSIYSAVIPKFIFSMLEGKSPVIFGDGKQTRDFTYVDNVVEANILAVQQNISGEIINIGTEKQISINTLVENLNEIMQTNFSPSYTYKRPGDIEHSIADITKAKKLLGYIPNVSFKEGLKKTVNYFKKIFFKKK